MSNLAVNKINNIATDVQKEQMKIVIVGHVDHGKSTLIGRLFYETDSLPEGKLEQIQNQCKKRGMPFEYSFLLDALQAERDQGITIDTTQIWFKTVKRNYTIIDAPGHKEFLKNMVSGAANSEAAVLVIDAKEGVKEQSKRHGYLLSLLGVNQVAVAVNKMDLINYDEVKYNEIVQEYTNYLASINVKASYFIPISGREGDNITKASDNTTWYKGPSVLEALDEFTPKPTLEELPLRISVQDVYKFDERRIIAGRIESGKVKVGDKILFSPSNTIVKVNSIETWPESDKKSAIAGESVSLTLSDQIFAERGQIISHIENPPTLQNNFRAKLFWLGDKPLSKDKKYLLKISTAEYQVEVKEIERIIDTDNLSNVSENREVPKNAVAEVIFRIKGIAALDEFAENAQLGRFVIVEDYRTVGGGNIDLRGFASQRVVHDPSEKNLYPFDANVSQQKRALANGHKGGVLWFSGLSGAGKSTIANALQQRLFAKGYQVYVLDGDNIRNGLNSDLSFSNADRSENIRRVGEVAALFADAGIIAITAFISPFKSDRDKARVAAKGNYHSIYIKADVETCAKRDPKGLYDRAKKGEIQNFTGISSAFEEPDNADLIVDTKELSIDEAVEKVYAYIERNFVLRDESSANDFAI